VFAIFTPKPNAARERGDEEWMHSFHQGDSHHT